MSGTEDLQAKLLASLLFLGSAWILYLLLGLSVMCLTVAMERLLHFWQHSEPAAPLQKTLSERLSRGDVAAVCNDLKPRRSHAAQVALAGLQALPLGPAVVQEVMQAAAVVARLHMERGVIFLGTVGNNAPFIGLFGTVLGIIRAFHDLSSNTMAGSSAVMAGIAEALATTAVGLLVALPAVALFNLCQRRIRVQVAVMDVATHVVLAYAKSTGTAPKQS